MNESAGAGSRYELEVERIPLLRRARGISLTVISAVITFGDFAPSPPLKRYRIIDRTTGETAAVVDEKTEETVDLGSLIRSDLAEMHVDEFERISLAPCCRR